MSPVLAAARAGVVRGRIELRQTFTNGQDLWNYVFPTVAFLIVLFFMKGAAVPGTSFNLGARTLPSLLGMIVAFSGLVTLMMALALEREDGTLLRAKAIPNGMLGYLVGKLVLVSGMTIASIVIIVVPSSFMLDGLALTSVTAWLMLLGVMVLGLVATLPLGAVFGSLFTNPRNAGVITLPVMGLVAISGIFYPLSGYPEWLQGIGQVFPIYWLGLGMRSALLPSELAAVEIGGSWRHLEMVGVLGAWAIVGLIVAPMVLRRMARRESGSSVAQRREKALQRLPT
jgi:ABC-2 type transport system permease protein